MPHFIILLALLVSGAAVLTACERSTPSAESEPRPQVDNPDVLVTINGVAITRSDLFSHAGLGLFQGGNASQDVLDELIHLELLRQRAVADGLDNDPEIRLILANLEKNLLASQVIERHAATLRFSEAEIEAEYNAQIATLGTTEYRASHILVRTEAEALELLAQLNAGSAFADLARAHSQDISSDEGGDLGWFTPAQMVPAFSEVLVTLSPGDITEQPVQSQFGWHLIYLQETRELQPPPLNMVRDQVEEILQNRALRDYLETLREQATIEFPERPGN